MNSSGGGLLLLCLAATVSVVTVVEAIATVVGDGDVDSSAADADDNVAAFCSAED